MKNRILLFLVAFALAGGAWAIRIKSRPYLQNVGQTEATIVWTTDKPSVGWVELAPDDGSHFYASDRQRFWHSSEGIKQVDSVHAVRLTGLRPGTRYRYRICAQEVLSHRGTLVSYGYVTGTDIFSQRPWSFTTVAERQDTLSFAMVNDIHEDNERLKRLVELSEKRHPEFYLFNGDMISSLNSERQIFRGFMDMATRLFASEKPIYYARGNHETRGTFAPAIHRYFSPSEPHLYYTFRRGPVCFVVLDTGEDKPDGDVAYSGITDYDAYRTEQAAWLSRVVQSEAYRTAPFRVVVAHMPPMGGWHGNIEVMNKFVSVLKDARPDLMLCAHLHRFIHRPADGEIPFPVLVNSNRAVVNVKVEGGTMEVRVTDADAKELDCFTLRQQ